MVVYPSLVKIFIGFVICIPQVLSLGWGLDDLVQLVHYCISYIAVIVSSCLVFFFVEFLSVCMRNSCVSSHALLQGLQAPQ